MSPSLVLRLLRGSSGAGWLRLGLVILGLGVGTFAMLHVAMLPAALSARESVVEYRSFVPAGPDVEAAFRVTELTELWKGRRLTRVFLTANDTAAAPPPGVGRFPGPGEVVASQALAQAAAGDPDLARLLPGKVIGHIEPAGLLEPSELFAYVGTHPAASMVAATGWGAPFRVVEEEWRLGPVTATAVLVVPAVWVFLVACTRLASRTRQRRYAELRLLGMRRAEVSRIAFLETAVAGGAGVALGTVVFLATLRHVAGHGWMGLSWQPQLSMPNGWVLWAVWLGSVWLCGLLGRVGLDHALGDPLQARDDPAEQRPRWWALLPLAIGLGGVLAALSLRSDTPQVMGEVSAMATVLAIAAASLGLLLAVRHLIVGTGALVGKLAPWPLWRLAARRLVVAPSRASRLLTALCGLLLVVGIGSSATHAIDSSVGSGNRHLVAWVEGADLAPGPADMLSARRQNPGWLLQFSIPEDPDWVPPTIDHTPSKAEIIRTTGMPVIFMTCDDLALAAVVTAGQCRDGDLHLLHAVDEQPNTLAAVRDLNVRLGTDSGQVREFSVPAETLALSSGPLVSWVRSTPALLWAEPTPVLGWGQVELWYMLLDPTPRAWEELRADVAVFLPTATVHSGFENLLLAEIAASYRRALTSGGMIAAALIIAALLITTIDRTVQYRRDVTNLRILGLRRHQTRVAVVLQVLLPCVVVALAGTAVAHLAGNALVLTNQRNEQWYLAGTLRLLWLVPVAGAVIALVLYLSTDAHLRSNDLRKE